MVIYSARLVTSGHWAVCIIYLVFALAPAFLYGPESEKNHTIKFLIFQGTMEFFNHLL